MEPASVPASPPRAPAGPPLSRLAMVAWVLALLPTGPIAVGLGWLALVRIRRGLAAGRPVAIAAIAMGLVWAAGEGLILALYLLSGVLHYERAAVDELAQFHRGQLRFRAARVVDQDGNGAGEFGLFAEVGGGGVGRTAGGTGPIARTDAAGDFVSRLFAHPDAQGIVVKWGYCFRLYQPGVAGTALGVHPEVPPGVAAAAARQEQEYLVYAWPEVHGGTGVRAFLLEGRTGVIWESPNGTAFKGTARIPGPGDAFAGPGPADPYPPANASPGPAPDALTRDQQAWAPRARVE